jgi:hypothetical protein
MSGEAIDALERWHATTQALRAAKPGTAEFVRLRMIAQEQHAAYEALIDRAEDLSDREPRAIEDTERSVASR